MEPNARDLAQVAISELSMPGDINQQGRTILSAHVLTNAVLEWCAKNNSTPDQVTVSVWDEAMALIMGAV